MDGIPRRSLPAGVLLAVLVLILGLAASDERTRLEALPISASHPTVTASSTATPTPAPSSDDPSLPDGARSHIESSIAAREYQPSESGDGLQAPNRAHNLRTWFDETGIRVHDRTAPGSPELLTLSLAALGRGDAMHAVPPGDPATVSGDRVEIARPGLVEWFVNGPEGLEQGFTLSERPVGDGDLRLELALQGATARGSGGELTIASASGRQLSYGQIAAWDARGRKLDAALEVSRDGRIALRVDDSGATYPVVVDPLLTATADGVFESDQIGAYFGTSVAVAGDLNADGYADVIVGAPQFDAGQTDEGAAFVFLGGSGGIPNASVVSAQAQLESNQISAQFGASVASAGDVNGDGYDDVIVGAYYYDAGQTDEGAAFVFLGGATGIADGNPATAHARLESDQANADFGVRVASAGDVNGDGYSDVVVGSRYYDVGQVDEGAAFVFLGGPGGIPNASVVSAQAQLESNQSGSEFGTSVASAGDVNGDGYDDVVVGAYNYDAGQTDEGSVFVFLGSAAGVADGNPTTAHAWLESNQANAQFGVSAASAGDVNGDGFADVVVGSPAYDAGQLDEGAAFVFLGSAAGIANGNPTTAHARLESDELGANLGTSVGAAGDVDGDGYSDLIVGAPGTDTGATPNAGAALVFVGSASGIASGGPFSAYRRVFGPTGSAFSGSSVSSAGDVNGDGFADVVVGAFFASAGQTNEGQAFTYLGGGRGFFGAGTASTAATRLESNQASAFFGTEVASAGDVNGDGYADVLVGAFGYDSGQVDEGAAFVFLGSATGVGDAIPASANARLESNQAGAWFGYSVASAGDVNGDGYADVVVGSFLYDSGQTDEGAAFVFLGSATGIASGSPATAHARLESDQASAVFGVRVASAGDVNGDGYSDVIVGASSYDAGQLDEGAAFVFLGSAAGIANGSPATAHVRLEGDQASSKFGRGVASAGDVDGDGYSDVIVGADQYDAGQADEGAAFVFLGSATGLSNGNPSTAHAQLESDQAGAHLGYCAASAGDVNGDGFSDVVAGAYAYDGPSNVDGGAAFVFLGSASGVTGRTPATAHARLTAGTEPAMLGSQFGLATATAGDVNGDGYADVIVSAPLSSFFASSGGVVAVFPGSSTGIADSTYFNARWGIPGGQANAEFGGSATSAGDVNGDGFADLIVGSLFFDSGQTDEGAAFVFQGGGNLDGRPVALRQRRGDGSGIPVQSLGRVATSDGFIVELRANHPQGRGRVKAQYEVCPSGIPFDDPGCDVSVSPNWIAVGGVTPDVSIAQPLSGRFGERLYRWRARVLRAPATGPIPAAPAHGPWRRLDGQAFEGDLRLVPEPGLGLGLACGFAAIGLAAMRRRGR